MATLGELTLNPQTGEWEQQQTFDPIQNQWAWGDNGLMALGGDADYTVALDPFLSVAEQYRGGAPIDAPTWQEAVQKSLTGFMRANYGVDPVLNWDQSQSGLTPGSQFRIGTLQDLVNMPGMGQFFNTGNLSQYLYTGDIIPGTGPGTNFTYDPLLGLDPTDKLLAFEDTPFEQIEKLVGGMPGRFLDMKAAAASQAGYKNITQQIANYERQYQDLTKQLQNLPGQTYGGMSGSYELFGKTYNLPTIPGGVSDSPDPTKRQAIQSQLDSVTQQLNAARQQEVGLRGRLENEFWRTPEQARASGLGNDFNDFLFKLDVGAYTPPPEMIKASPESVLKKFFDTPEYRLAFGNDPRALDPSISPTERFKFDPGYEFSQQEGFRQLQNRAASRGLLESGPTQRDLQGYSQGLADQNYQRWLSQNIGLYDKWQGQQAQLAAMGPQVNGSTQALQTGQGLAALSGQQGSQASQILGQLGLAGMQGYSNLGNAGLGAFGNLGGIGANAFGNLGTTGLTALTNAGIAQGNNMTQAKIAQAQLQAQQQASQSQGFGQMAGQLMGAFF